LDTVVAAYRERLRGDPELPMAAGLLDTELEDHASSFLADIAQSLVILGETGGQPDLLRDGSDLQRLISERHGAQRARLGWDEDALRREFVVLRQEIDAVLRRCGIEETHAAMAALAPFVDRACEISVRGLVTASSARPPTTADVLAQTERVVEETRLAVAHAKDDARHEEDARAPEAQTGPRPAGEKS
ncbi:MAG: hypothetical protein ICV87_07485, partial [Gemmatimonadetes bacterium]|nr:hypothetical protein [Gemmatimonadota bacterium]